METKNKFCRNQQDLPLEKFKIIQNNVLNSKASSNLNFVHSYIEGYLNEEECWSESCPLPWNGWAYISGEIITLGSEKKNVGTLFSKYALIEEDIFNVDNLTKLKLEIALDYKLDLMQKEFDSYIKSNKALEIWHNFYQKNYPQWYNIPNSFYRNIENNPEKYGVLYDFFDFSGSTRDLFDDVLENKFRRPLIRTFNFRTLCNRDILFKEGNLVLLDPKRFDTLTNEYGVGVLDKIVEKTRNKWQNEFSKERQELRAKFNNLTEEF